MAIKLLTKKDIQKLLKEVSDWKLNTKETEISKSYEFPSFITALAFVAKVAVHAEVLRHHPDVELSYGKVKLKITTHDAKGLTKMDFELAQSIDGVKE